jgi:hypothetical protein
MSQAELQGPAKPRRLRVVFERSSDRLGLRCRSRAKGAGFFMLIWLIGWTVGCVFLAGLVYQHPKMFTFLFAIPFEVIGLLILGGFLAALLEPVHRTVWTFSRRGIDCRHTWLGIGPHRTREPTSLDRVELRRSVKGGQQGSPRTAVLDGEERLYGLSLIDQSNAELCSIKGLTEGEGRWMGDIILRERTIWFR